MFGQATKFASSLSLLRITRVSAYPSIRDGSRITKRTRNGILGAAALGLGLFWFAGRDKQPQGIGDFTMKCLLPVVPYQGLGNASALGLFFLSRNCSCLPLLLLSFTK